MENLIMLVKFAMGIILGFFSKYLYERFKRRAQIDEDNSERNFLLKSNNVIIEDIKKLHNKKEEYFKMLFILSRVLCDGSIERELLNKGNNRIIDYVLILNRPTSKYVKDYQSLNNDYDAIINKIKMSDNKQKIKNFILKEIEELKNYFMDEIYIEIRNDEMKKQISDRVNFNKLSVGDLSDKKELSFKDKYHIIYDEKFDKLIEKIKKKFGIK
ncbi:MAG: hypothetical protein ACLFPJ_06100 [Candidatus Woesearchaeota archaeon]